MLRCNINKAKSHESRGWAVGSPREGTVSRDVYLTGHERVLDHDKIIVSKTDMKGRITYVNEVFCQMAGYTPRQAVGAPHSIVRHPRMPRCVFKLLWDTLAQEREIFAFVNNRASNGDHYWVFAHVTPSRDLDGGIVGYHSSRRSVDRDVVRGVVAPLYEQLWQEEQRHANPKDGMAASLAMVTGLLSQAGKSYDEFIFSL